MMNTWIVLLRGINVGGHKKVPMAELRKLLSDIGFRDVSTYIQSGNVILKSEENEKANIEMQVRQAIHDHFGFEIPVIAKTRDALLRIFEACPFSEENKAQSYFVMLHKIPDETALLEVANVSYENEEFHIVNDALYFFASAGYGNAKFNMNTMERKLAVNATARNYKTMVKLLAMSAENDEDQ